MNLVTKVIAALESAEQILYEPGDSVKEMEWVKRKEAQRIFLSAVAIDETNKLEQFAIAHNEDFRVNPESVYLVYYNREFGFKIRRQSQENMFPEMPEGYVLIYAITNCEDWEDVWHLAGDATLRFESLNTKERQEWLDNLKLL